ncbi:MAG TPA: hypothetical protein VNC61_07100 [Acidimicrobiales bacterium]|nr:hypothetical protein [Acidimicrobiales bacterium]
MVVSQALVWSAADASAGTTTTTASSVPANLPPAPPGFAATLVTTYQSEVVAAQTLGHTQGYESVAQYQQKISTMNGASLAAMYYVTQQNPEWSQIPSLMQTVIADVPASSSGAVPATQSAFRGPGASAGAKTATLMAFRVGTPSAVGGKSPLGHAQLTAAIPTNSVAPVQNQSCPAAPPEAAIFAAQIVIDVASGLYNTATALVAISAFASNFVAIGIAAVVALSVLLVAQVVHDTLVYLQSLSNDCAANNLANTVSNIDNTTLASYNLATSTMALIVQSQSIETTTDQDVQNLQAGLTLVQQTLVQALTSSTNTLDSTNGGDTQQTTTELQIIQTALQNDLTTIQKLQTTTSQQVVAGVSGIQSTLSVDLSQIIHEIDVDAQGLTTLITAGNQQILNALQTNFAMTQQEFQSNLQIEIEQGLQGWAPVVPEVQLMLPSSMGGYLDSTPVGVQEVVTTDIASLQKLGVAVKALAITELAAANAALAAGKYTVAWTDYAIAYQLAA